MATDYVTLGTTSGGAHARAAPGEPVDVPLDGLRGARGLVAGAPDSGIEDAAGSLAHALHDAGQPVLLVDPDGSHCHLAGEHGLRQVGGGRGCDVQVTPDNADRITTVAGEGEESLVLDCSSFGEHVDQTDVLRRVVESLGRTRRNRTSLVVVLANCHEWLPDAGQSACADALCDVGPETAPGVGVIGVTDRPGAVDARYRRNCDWIAAHRVSWREHVDAVTRILGRGYEDALASLDDGEAFLEGPWVDAVQRVRFEPSTPETRGVASSRGMQSDTTAGSSSSSSHQPGSTAAASDLAEVSAELADLRDRLDDLEATVTDRDDATAVAEALADAIADGLDARAVTATDAGSTKTESGSETETEGDRDPAGGDEPAPPDAGGGFGDVFDAFDAAGEDSASGTATTGSRARTAATGPSTASRASKPDSNHADDGGGGMSFEPMNFAFDEGASGGAATPDDVAPRRSRSTTGERRVPRYVRDTVRAVEEMDPTTRKMLAHYVDRGADTPLNAHFSAGGAGDRTAAYAHNRQLRTTGFVEHVGRGHYAPTIPEKVRETAGRELSTDDVSKAAEHVRRALPS